MPRDWTDPERLAAMYLYCQTPFGRLHARNPEIIALAERMGRTPSSLAMKLTNFASLDPEQQRRGIKGLRAASAGDRVIWQAFHANWSRMVEASAEAYESYSAPGAHPDRLFVRDRHEPRPWGGGATTVERTVAARRGQGCSGPPCSPASTARAVCPGATSRPCSWRVTSSPGPRTRSCA